MLFTNFLERLPKLRTEIYLQMNEKSMHQRSEIPGLFYEMRANFNNEFYEINSFGMRDDEPKRTNKKIYRVIVLGDSVTFGGRDLKKEQLFTEIAEEILRKRNKKIEILNAGVNGYNTAQEFIALKEKHLQLNPKLVVFAFCINDFHQAAVQYLPDEYVQRRILKSGITPTNDLYYRNLSEKQYLGLILPQTRFLPYKIDRWLILNSGIYRTLSLLKLKKQLNIKNYNDIANFLISPEFSSTLQNIKELSKKYNFSVKFLILPTNRDFAKDYLFDNLTKKGIDFWDFNFYIKSLDKTSFWYDDSMHLTRNGHAFVGEMFAQKLAEIIPQ